MTTYQRRFELVRLGFYIEDMEDMYGTDFRGQFRWMNDQTDEFQDDVSYSLDKAWDQADAYARANVTVD